MPRTKHLDEARHDATECLRQLVETDATIKRAVLITDLFGKIRVVLWPGTSPAPDLAERIGTALVEAAGPFWSTDVWIASDETKADQLVYDRAWEEGVQVTEKLRRTDRHRTKGSWLQGPTDPPWAVDAAEALRAPPIVAFYSFKGRVGRTTALAAFAIQRAREGERVAVLDLDLDAPGAGSLLAPGRSLAGAQWGIVDYLLERPFGEVDFRDYYHTCAEENIVRSGSILVVPAGRIDSDYLVKLARLDMEPRPLQVDDPLRLLLDDVRTGLEPRWILIDARAGLSEPAGFALSGLAHLSVLFGTTSEQSWLGLRLVIERLGADRIRQDQPQAECLLVHAMVPSNPDLASLAATRFANRAQDEFTDHYYVEDTGQESEDRFWSVRDLDAQDAPHVPLPLHYNDKLTMFTSIDQVADDLAQLPDYDALGSRVLGRFRGGLE